MKPKISILGCGWLGKALAYELILKGYNVKGSSTSNNNFDKLKLNGITPFVIDINKITDTISDFLLSDILIIAIPSKNISGFENLIIKIEASELRKVIFISATSVYPNTNGEVTEQTETNNTPLAYIENLFKSNSVFETTIIRFGGLFGYDRKPGNFVKNNKIIQNPEGYVNLIHRDDCIRIIENIIIKNTWKTILNACTDSHPTRRAFYQKEAKKVGKMMINFDEKSENNYKIVNSDKLKSLLDFEFKYAELMD